MKKRKNKRKKLKEVGRPERQNQPDEATDTDSFDFGGLPDRDLKKNLGCG